LRIFQRYLSALRLLETHAAVPLQQLVQQQLQRLFVDDKCAHLTVPLLLQPPQPGDRGRLADGVGKVKTKISQKCACYSIYCIKVLKS